MTLPNELIIRILRYTDPSVLVKIALSTNTHLQSFSHVPELLRELDFCKSCIISNSDLVKFLSAERIHAIENLCIRGYQILPSVFCGSSYQWSSLRKLDISNSYFNIYEFLYILDKLDELEEVSWSTYSLSQKQQFASKRQKLTVPNFKIKKLTTLNLDIMCKSLNFQNVLGLLSLFKEISILRLNVYHSFEREQREICVYVATSDSDCSDDDTKYISQTGDVKGLIPSDFKSIRFSRLKEFCLRSDKHQRWGRNYPVITHVRCICSSLHCFVKQRVAEPPSLETKVLVIPKDMHFLNDLTWVTEPNCLPTINIQSRQISQEILHWIKYHGGSKLKCLSLTNSYSDWRRCRVLPELFEACPNIEELNLDEYFDSYKENENYLFFSLLPNLRALVLSDFLIKNNSYTKIFLKKMNAITSSNPHLTELEIRSNLNRRANICDVDLSPIRNFSDLKKLTLINLSGSITGSCFKEIFANCTQLTILKLYHLELYSDLLLFNENVIQHLTLLSNIKVLCLHHKKIDFSLNCLWTFLSLLGKLESVCLGSDSITIANNEALTVFLDNVPNLEVFHIHSKAPNCDEIQKVMKKHKCFIEKPKAEIVVHDIGPDANIFNVTKWQSYSSSFTNKRSLCWGMSDVGYDLRNTCGINNSAKYV